MQFFLLKILKDKPCGKAYYSFVNGFFHIHFRLSQGRKVPNLIYDLILSLRLFKTVLR